MEYVSSQSKLPFMEHYAVLVFGSITIPGDERSRTNPGHGYEEHQQFTIEYIVFASKEEMEQWAAKQPEYKKFVPAIIKPLTVTKTTKIS